MTPETDFATQLKRLRHRAVMSQAELALRSGVPLLFLQRVERGQADPLWSTVVALSRALDTSAAAFEVGNHSPNGETFAQRLRQLREGLGLSKQQLATLCSITPSQLGGYEEGRNEPGWGRLVRLARALGVTPDAFLPASRASRKTAAGFGRRLGK